MYDEEYIVEYSGDLWTKRKGVIRVLCFVGNNMNLLLFKYFRWYWRHFIHVRTNTNYFENGVENISRTRGIKGGLKMDDM